MNTTTGIPAANPVNTAINVTPANIVAQINTATVPQKEGSTNPPPGATSPSVELATSPQTASPSPISVNAKTMFDPANAPTNVVAANVFANPAKQDPIPSGKTVEVPPVVTNSTLMNPAVKDPDETPEVTNAKINVVVHNNNVEKVEKKVEGKKEEEKKKEETPIQKSNNTLKPVYIEDDIKKAPASFSPMIPIEHTPEGKGLSNILVIGSEVIHVTHPGQRFRSQGGFNVLYIGSSEKELRDLYGITTDAQLCAMQRAFGVRYMHQKPEIEISSPPCAVQDKDVIIQALKTRLKTLGHQLSIVPDNLAKARYLVQRKYLQDILKKIESTPGDAKPCPVVERREANTPQMPNLKELFSGMSKSSDCLQNMQLLQQLMMIMMLLLGSVSDKDIQNYLDQIPLEKILQIARTPKPSRNNLDVIQGAIDSLYTIYMKRQQKGIMENIGTRTNNSKEDLEKRIRELEGELEAYRTDHERIITGTSENVTSRNTRIRELEGELETARSTPVVPGTNQGSQQEIADRDTRIRELEAELETARSTPSIPAAPIPTGPNNASQQTIRERDTRIRELEAELEAARQQLQNQADRPVETVMGIQDVLPSALTPEIYQEVSEGGCGTSPVETQNTDYFDKIEIIGDGACMYSSLYYAYIHHLYLKYPDNEEYRRIIQDAREKTQQDPPQGSKIPTGELQRYFDILQRIFEATREKEYCYGSMKLPYNEMYQIAPSSDRLFPEYMERSFQIEENIPKEFGLAYIHGLMFAIQSHFHVRVYTENKNPDGSIRNYNLIYSTESNPISNVKGYLNILQDPTEFSIPGEEMSNEEKANLRAQGASNNNIKKMSSGLSGSVDHYHVLFPRQLEEVVETEEAEGEDGLQIQNIYVQLRPLFEEASMEGLVSAPEINITVLMNYINTYTGIIRSQGHGDTTGQQADITRLEGELSAALAKAGTNISAKNSRIAELERQLQEAEGRATQAGTNSTTKNATIEDLRRQLADAEGRATQAGTNSTTKNTKITDLERQLQEARDQATQTGTNVSAKNTKIAELERQLQEARDQATQTGTNSSAKNTKIAELERQLQEAEGRVTQAGTNSTTKNATIEDLRRQLQEAEGRATQTSQNIQTKESELQDIRDQLKTAQQNIEQLQSRTPQFDSSHLEHILGILLADEGLRTRANSYIQGRENTDLLTDLGIYMESNDKEVCKIYNTLQQLVYTQERFFYTLNDKTYNLDGDIFQEYFNSVPAYENKDLLKELVTIIRDIISLRSGSVVTTGDLPILQSIVNSTIKTGKNVQYTGLMTELKSLYNKHKFMTSSIKTTTDPKKLQIGTIEPSSTNNYIPGMIFYIRFVQLSKKFIDTSLNAKCGSIDAMVGTETTARVPSPLPVSPPARSRSPSPGRSYQQALGSTANPYVGQKSDAELYRR